jgi:hypothetical protein
MRSPTKFDYRPTPETAKHGFYGPDSGLFLFWTGGPYVYARLPEGDTAELEVISAISEDYIGNLADRARDTLLLFDRQLSRTYRKTTS